MAIAMLQSPHRLFINLFGKVVEYQQVQNRGDELVPYLRLTTTNGQLWCGFFSGVKRGRAFECEGLYAIVQNIQSGPALQALHLMLQEEPITEESIRGMGGELANHELCTIFVIDAL